MKKAKILTIVLVIVLAATVFAFAGCNNTDTDNSLRIAMPDGTPCLAMANLFDGNKNLAGYKLDMNVVSANLIGNEVLSGKADIAIMPTNAFAQLYNKGVDYQIITSNIFGVLYIIGNPETAFELSNLTGKVVSSIGKTNTPEYVFKKILDYYDIPYVEASEAVAGKVAISYVDDGSQAIQAVKNDEADYAIVGEPAVTNAASKGLVNHYDLQEGWSIATGGSSKYPQASLVMKSSLAKDKKFVTALVEKLYENLEYLKDEENLANLTSLFAEYGSATTFPAASIANCNVDVKWAYDIKDEMKTYLGEFGITLKDDNCFYNYAA